MHKTKRLLFSLIACAASLVGHAQNSADEPVILDSLRVTADLWASPLDRIAASVTVMDEAALKQSDVRHFSDLVDQIPNLSWTGATSRPRYLQIRGVGENSQYEGETPDSAVRFLLDDLDLTGLGSIGSSFDLQQVEVLRGPQAGAFGANAAGGIVRLVSNAPTPIWTGQTEVRVGSDSLRSVGLAVGGPLIESDPKQLMMRVALQQNESDGFRYNRTVNADTNARDEFTGRLRLTWNPHELWTWEAAVVFADFDSGFDAYALDNNGEFTYSDQPGRDEQRTLAGSLRGTYHGWDAARVTSVTSGARTHSRYAYDDDWTAASYMGFSDLNRTRWVLNQELRLDSDPARDTGTWIDRWTVGAFYSATDEVSRYTNESPWSLRTLKTTYHSKNTALFGKINHDISGQTRVIFGLRGETIDIDGDGFTSKFRKGSATYDPTTTLTPQFDDTMIGGKLTLEHDLSPRELLFVTLSRGYKSGGINIDARIDPTTDPLTYDTETLWNFEAGLRGNWADGRVSGELTGFYLQRKNTQVRDSAGFGGSYRFFTDNGNDAYVYGLEAAGSFAITEVWSLKGSIGLMRSELDQFTLSNGNTGGGRELANAPRYGYTIGTRYGAATGFFGSADFVRRASQFDSNSQNEARREFEVVNVSVGYAWERWSVTLWAKNLFDEQYDNRVFFFGNEGPNYTATRYEDRAAPQQVGITGSYRF